MILFDNVFSDLFIEALFFLVTLYSKTKNLKAPGDKSSCFSRTIGPAIRSARNRKESCRENWQFICFLSHWNKYDVRYWTKKASKNKTRKIISQPKLWARRRGALQTLLKYGPVVVFATFRWPASCLWSLTCLKEAPCLD